MDDTLVCPICQNKLRTYNAARYLFPVSKYDDYAERTCTTGINHTLQFFTNINTNKVELVKISLDPKYSRFFEADYINRRCRVSIYKDSKPEHINIPRLINLDFPDLIKLKEIVGLYVVFI